MRQTRHVAIALVATLITTCANGQGNLVDAVEFYHAVSDHYFFTASPIEVNALDSGLFAGWTRTGLSFKAYDAPSPSANPVCRFYLPPMDGDSHFYSASPAECSEAQLKFPTFVYESPNVLYAGLPNATTGACGNNWTPVYRLWNRRPDTNHRYTTDKATRDAMVAKGYVSEGYGIDGVAMCAPIPNHRDANFLWYSDNNAIGLTDDLLHGMIDHIKAMGFGGVQFLYNVNVDPAGNVLDTYDIRRMWRLVDYARAQTLTVSVVVNWVHDGTQDIVGTYHDSVAFEPALFLSGVRVHLKAAAAMAHLHGVSTIYVGFQNSQYVRREFHSRWAEIIADIKSIFEGTVSYLSSNNTTWWGSLDDVGIWDLVDAIGIRHDPTVSLTPVYDVNAVLSYYYDNPIDQTNIVRNLIDISRKYDKPIVIWIAFSNFDSTLSGNGDPKFVVNFGGQPWTLATPVPFNPTAQAIAYRSVLELVNKNLATFAIGYTIGDYEPWVYGSWNPAGVPGLYTADEAFQFNNMKYYNILECADSERVVAEYLRTPWGHHVTSITKGGPSDDVIYVSGGENLIYPLGGRDEVRGGPGVDTVVIGAALGSCSIVRNTVSSATTPRAIVKCGADELSLWDVEKLKFNDAEIAL